MQYELILTAKFKKSLKLARTGADETKWSQIITERPNKNV